MGAVSLVNYRWYGVARLNEQNAPPFSTAFGSLLRVKDARATLHALVPYSVRRAVYRVSPTFASIEPFLDGQQGSWGLRRAWIADTCAFYPPTCPDYAGTWTMWAFRQAAADAGMHGDPRVADAFYARITAEVDAACRSGALRCEAARSSVVPALEPRDLPELASAFVTGCGYTLSMPVRDYVYDPNARSVASAAGLAEFRDLTRGDVLPAAGDDDPRGSPGVSRSLRLRILGSIAIGYQRLFAAFVYAGLGAFLFSVLRAIRRRTVPPLVLFATAVLALAAGRLAMLSYIEISMFPAFALWPAYITPLYPLLIVFSGVALVELVEEAPAFPRPRRAHSERSA